MAWIMFTIAALALVVWGDADLVLLDAAGWVRGAGALGVAAYAGMFIGWSLLGLPASVIQGGAAWLWGPWGVPFAWVVSSATSAIAFRLARGGLSDLVRSRFGGHTLVRAIDLAAAEHGLRLVVLLRLSPLAPFNLVSYVLGLTRVRPGQAMLGTVFGSMVPIGLYGMLGATARDFEALINGSAAQGSAWFPAVAIGVTLGVTIGVSWMTRRAMARVLAS